MELLANIDVDDLDRGIAFYEAALGLTVGRRLGPSGVEMTGASSAIYLLLKAEGTKPSAATDDLRDYRRHWTPVHLDFVVPEIEAAVERVLGAGGTIEGTIDTHEWGRIAHMADPFGHGFCLIEFLGRGYDEIATD